MVRDTFNEMYVLTKLGTPLQVVFIIVGVKCPLFGLQVLQFYETSYNV